MKADLESLKEKASWCLLVNVRGERYSRLDSRRCHLTKENITESELTLQRAGYFGKTAQQSEKMFVCPIHCTNLGKDWGNPTGRTECRYPDHKGKHTCTET